jgi:hypothetical protein
MPGLAPNSNWGERLEADSTPGKGNLAHGGGRNPQIFFTREVEISDGGLEIFSWDVLRLIPSLRRRGTETRRQG